MRAMKKWLASLMALALLAGMLPAALAAETTIYLDGYHLQGEEGAPGVYEVKEGGQLSLKGDLTRTGVVESKEFEDAAEIFEIPVYTAKGSVEVTVTDGYVPGEPTEGTDENGDIWAKLALAAAGIDTVTYDAEKKSAETVKENALYFEGKITYVEANSEEEKTVSLQEFYGDPDIWDKIGTPPSIHKGSKAVLTEPGAYRVSAYYEALAGGCIAYVIIPESADTADTPDTTTVPEETEGTTPAAPKFTDVAADSPYAAAIGWAVGKEITNGKTATTFVPGEPCTRAQIVTFLWRAAGSPEPKLTENQYEDVTDDTAYYYKAVQWAAEMDMEFSGTFRPGEPCDRGSAVYFIWKAGGSPKAEAKASFTDLPEAPKDGGQYYWNDFLDAVNWALEQGVTKGTGDGSTFSSGSPCTRGQIVTFLFRAAVE